MLLQVGHRALIAGGPAGDAGLKLPAACTRPCCSGNAHNLASHWLIEAFVQTHANVSHAVRLPVFLHVLLILLLEGWSGTVLLTVAARACLLVLAKTRTVHSRLRQHCSYSTFLKLSGSASTQPRVQHSHMTLAFTLRGARPSNGGVSFKSAPNVLQSRRRYTTKCTEPDSVVSLPYNA